MELTPKKRALLIAGAALVVIGGGWLLWPSPKVEGDTPEEQIESIQKIAAEKPWGGGKALARAYSVPRGDVRVRRAALAALAAYPQKDMVPTVRAALAAPEPEIQEVAAEVLGRVDKDDATADELGKIASENTNPGVRIGAIKGLGNSESQKALAWLIRLGETEATPAVHRQILLEAYNKVSKHYYWPEQESATELKRQQAIESLKGQIQVQESYRYAQWQLVRHPEYKYSSSHREKE